MAIKFLLCTLLLLPLVSLKAMRPPTDEELAALPPVPETVAPSVLAAERHPLLLTPEAVEQGRRNVVRHPSAQRYLEQQKKIAARFVAMEPGQLRALVPKPGSLYVMGLAMDLDPLHGERMKWAGWDHPFSVRDRQGALYPNPEWPDSGSGYLDPKSRKRFFFVALANAAIVKELEREVLPALADVYTLSGSLPHAQAAATLLDALAAAYPSSIRGPLDYPLGGELRRYGGRLDRPTQQVARGLTQYAEVIDLIAASGVLEAPSATAQGQTIREHVARSILWDGGRYCLLFGDQSAGLGNGVADYQHGAAIAGLLLGETRFADPLTSGPKNIYQMLRNNLARQEFYFETSPGYEFFTMELYRNSAELIEALRRGKLIATPSLFGHPGFVRLMTMPFEKREVGGHIPLLGNTRVDLEWVDPSLATLGPALDGTQARFRQAEWRTTQTIRLRASDTEDRQRAAGGLRTLAPLAKEMTEPHRWLVYHLPDAESDQETAPSVGRERPSQVEGGKGLAILRGGAGKRAHGLQLFFGPSQVKSQYEALSWTFYHRGVEWSYDPGRFNAHFRFGWSASSVAHQSLVVDRENVEPSAGTGHLLAFGEGEAMQWVMGTQPQAYHDKGVTRFERFLAQVQDRPGGDLLYWLDIGRVEGGQRREESFHTAMKKVAPDASLDWGPPAEGSVMGKENFGALLQGDYRLKGYQQGFYWTPPGAGYGFLASPRKAGVAQANGPVRTVWSEPLWLEEPALRLVVDFPQASDTKRQFILAQGPQAAGHPGVPYLLQSDEGPGGSVFVKVLHFNSGDDAPVVKGVRAMPLSDPDQQWAGAWLVSRRDGVRDLWIVNNQPGTPLRLAAQEGFPLIETDALFLLVRSGADGELLYSVAQSASYVRMEGGPQWSGPAARNGSVRAVEESARGVRLRVDWEGGKAPDSRQTPALARSIPPVGQPSTWAVRSVEGDGVDLRDASAVLGGGAATLNEEGWLEFPHELSRFCTGSARTAHTAFALGKPVYAGDRLLGRISELRADAQAIRLDVPVKTLPASTDLEIREIAPGDRLSIPLLFEWHRPTP